MDKKILLIIAQNGFRDEELLEPKKILKEAGFSVIVTSETKGKCIGSHGVEIESDISLNEINASEYVAAFIIGGPKSPLLMELDDVGIIMKDLKDSNKLFGAICLGPMVLASFDLIKGYAATVYKTEQSLSMFKEKNVSYVEDRIVIDRNLLTANGPLAAKEFGEKIVFLLNKNKEEYEGKRYKIIYHKKECIGAFACLAAEPKSWKQTDDKVDLIGAKVDVGEGDQVFVKEVDDLENNLEAAQCCPVNCIHIFDKKTRRKIL
ncbi:DJ-1/PfpI family protein [Candidatus Woesearchaeota archaeon]|nr:DJ-1/PfpI family protein [Candidatus Woesearchaeota archaeon]MCF8012994.1 DJ-1/PfpI family protein [Candidatus Woesearchaeota archaeon]